MADIKAKSFNFGGSDRYIIPQDFIINVTVDSEGNSTADKTYAEILEAYNMGHTLYVNVDSYRLSLAAILNGTFVFTMDLVDIVMLVQISESEVIGDMKFLEPVPAASTSDAGKVLMIGDDGNAAWTTIINAEEVAY